MKKIVISWFVCVLGLVALAALVGRDLIPDSDSSTASAQPLVKAEFALTDAHGKAVTQKDYRGRYMLVFFGFTHCPDICPTTLLLVQNVRGKLDNGKKIVPILISVDPERDTPKVMGAYVSRFGSDVEGLSGTPEQVKTAADNFKAYYSKVEMSDPSMGYMMNHSAFLYLIGPDGKFLAHFPNTIAENDLKASLKQYVR